MNSPYKLQPANVPHEFQLAFDAFVPHKVSQKPAVAAARFDADTSSADNWAWRMTAVDNEHSIRRCSTFPSLDKAPFLVVAMPPACCSTLTFVWALRPCSSCWTVAVAVANLFSRVSQIVSLDAVDVEACRLPMTSRSLLPLSHWLVLCRRHRNFVAMIAKRSDRKSLRLCRI